MENFTLPVELIVEIMLRLPVKSLLRFKCVCKSWLSLISDHQFAKSHFDLAATPTHRVLTTFNFDSVIMSLDFESSLTDGSDMPLKFPPQPPRLITGPRYVFNISHHSYRNIHIAGYCRGIMILATRDDVVIIWNPTTSTHRQLPVYYDKLKPMNLPNAKLYDVLHGFGYDKSTNDYLLVLIRSSAYASEVVKNSHPRIQIFSLKTNASSFIYGVDFEYNVSFLAGLYLNQSLHWLVKSKATRLPLVIAFDLIDRSFSKIPLSDDCVELYHNKICYLWVLGGYLSLNYRGRSDVADEIWVMKEYKVSSSWTRSFVLLPNITYKKNNYRPICFTKGGALLASSDDGTIMKLNEKGDVLEHSRDGLMKNGFPRHLCWYRESLLPLP